MVVGEKQVLRTGLAVDLEAAIPGPANLLHRFGGRNVDQQDWHVDDFGQGDGPMGRLALDRLGRHTLIVLERGGAGSVELGGQVANAVVALGMHHDDGAMGLGCLQGLENLAVVDRNAVVGHEDLVRGVAVFNQRRHFLAENMIRRVQQYDVEGVVDYRSAPGLTVIVLDRLAQAAFAVLTDEGDDRRGSAACRRCRVGPELAGVLDAVKGRLVDVDVAVDAAGQDQHTGGIDDFVGVQIVGERNDATTPDADVAAHGVGGRDHSAALDDKVILSHDDPPGPCLGNLRDARAIPWSRCRPAYLPWSARSRNSLDCTAEDPDIFPNSPFAC